MDKDTRIIYLNTLSGIINIAKKNEHVSQDIICFLGVLNSEDAPEVDQDLKDLIAETYIFLIFGYRPEHYPDGYISLDDAEHALGKAKASSAI